jgi:hypothetical protein
MYLSCGHTDVTLVNPKQDPSKWGGYTFCSNCVSRKLVAKVVEINLPDN